MTYILLLTSAVLAILNTTLFTDFMIMSARPDLILIILSYYSHTKGVRPGETGGFVIGLIEDVLSIAPLGLNAISRMAQGAVVGFSKGAVQADGILTPMVLTLIAMVVRYLSILLVATMFGLEPVIQRILHRSTLLETAVTIAIAPIVFFALNRLAKRITRRHGFS